jgi:hypothetical protein
MPQRSIFTKAFIDEFSSVSSLVFILPQLLLKNLLCFFFNLHIASTFIEVFYLFLL